MSLETCSNHSCVKCWYWEDEFNISETIIVLFVISRPALWSDGDWEPWWGWRMCPPRHQQRELRLNVWTEQPWFGVFLQTWRKRQHCDVCQLLRDDSQTSDAESAATLTAVNTSSLLKLQPEKWGKASGATLAPTQHSQPTLIIKITFGGVVGVVFLRNEMVLAGMWQFVFDIWHH